MASLDVAGDPLSLSMERVADMRPIRGVRDFWEEFRVESKKMWYLAGPAVFISVCHYSLSVVTQMFAGHLGTLELAAVSVGNYSVTGFSFAVLLGWGLRGAALVLNISYWLIAVAQLVYIFTGACGRTWGGFSWMALRNLWAFVRLSVASAIMISLEIWYFTTLVLVAGHLKNSKVSLDGLSICIRVSNELGAACPKNAKFSVVVILITSFVTGIILSLLLIITRKQYPTAFTSSQEVQDIVYSLTPLLVGSIIINHVQPVLSGVAVGAGWQMLIAYVNIGCFYAFGLPLGIIMGYKLELGVKGIWYGMLSGTMVQTSILICMIYRTNWNKEASIAGERVKQMGTARNSRK